MSVSPLLTLPFALDDLMEDFFYPGAWSEDNAEEHWNIRWAEWEASGMCAAFREALSTVQLGADTKIIAFGNGSFTDPRAYPRGGPEQSGELICRSHALQHFLMLTGKDVAMSRMAAGQANGIRCIAQDPCYSGLDKHILTRHGIETLDHPKAFNEIDNNSVVISISCNIEVKLPVWVCARPKVILWWKVTDFPGNTG